MLLRPGIINPLLPRIISYQPPLYLTSFPPVPLNGKAFHPFSLQCILVGATLGSPWRVCPYDRVAVWPCGRVAVWPCGRVTV